MKKALTAIAVITLLQSACSTSPKANPRFVVGKPYTEYGKTYFPTIQPEYKEIGMASWYGPGFHNRLTANGEVFNQNLMTAAHKTLPLPSIVKVTNLENGRSAYVRVNDRGPFAKNRVIDLSKQAAATLGLMNKGQAKVLVELEKNSSAIALNSVQISEAEKKSVLSQLQVVTGEAREVVSNSQASMDQQDKQFSSNARDTSPNPIQISKVEEIKQKNEQQAQGKTADLSGNIIPKSFEMKKALDGKSGSVNSSPVEAASGQQSLTASENLYFVQIKAVKTRENAEAESKKFANKFSSKIEEADVNGTKFYRVRLGGFESKQKAVEVKNSLKNIGYNDSFIVSPN
ncbi:MAG TPA: hypothetical protein DIV86_02400 [Alphaproteobacteria bacterium]|nr:hypothetical protein [Alphaproteobacteria bacterium]